MKHLRKWISCLLILCMVTSMLPMSVLALNSPLLRPHLEGMELVELPILQTSAPSVSTLALDSNGNPSIKSTREVKWIDRLADLPSYATDFYDWLVENSDGDGQADALIDPTTAPLSGDYYVYKVVSLNNNTLTYTYPSGASSSEIAQAAVDAISAHAREKFNTVRPYMITVYSAFNRDCPEVFWLSGGSLSGYEFADYSYTDSGNGTGTATYDINVTFILQSSDFDVRSEEYRSVSAIQSAITTRDNAVKTITSGASGTRLEIIKYLNNWLTTHNCYNSSSDLDNISRDCYSCLAALTGRTDTNGPICEGYARAFKVLCDALSIPCVLVDGTATNSTGVPKNHMWNNVQMDDGAWYGVDVTWNDPTVSGVTSAVSGSEREIYLLVGSQTVVSGKTFETSHVVCNTVYDDGTAFTNGPELAANSYGSATTFVIDSNFEYYSSITEETETYPFHYEDNWFFEDNTGYVHELAQMSIRMAMAAARTSSTSIQKLFKTLKFTNTTYHYPTPTTETIGYAIGSKEVTNVEGETITLIAVAIRGGGYKAEWGSNVTVGTSSEHEGFADASRQVLDGIEEHISSIGADENIRIWITGYSRAAATANMVAHQLNWDVRNNRIAGLSEAGIYAYCFACPMGVRTDHPSYSTLDRNIYNIVNPIDLVPMVAPSAWDFSRYGITYYFPSNEVNYSGFSSAFSKMKTQYSNIISGIGTGKSVSELTKYCKSQHSHFSDAVDALASYFWDQTTFVLGYQSDFVDALSVFNGNSSDIGSVVEAGLLVIPGFSILHPIATAYLISDLGKVSASHYPELCLAWMDSLDGDSLKKTARTRYLTVNCPVDISVYDSSGTLVAQITDDTVREISSSTIGAYIDENGQKIVILPFDEEFDIEITATDDGTMSYQIREYDIAEGDTTRVINYYDTPISKGDELNGTAGASSNGSASYTLLDQNNRELSASNDLSGNSISAYTVEVTSEGSGTVTGGGFFVRGEYAQVTAEPEEGYSFDGWYVNDTLVSADAEYRFRVESDVSIFGIFTETEAPHTHSYTSVVTAPTCTADGYTTYTCSVCGDSYTGNTVAATGHSWGSWTQTKAPACEEAGEEKRTCSACNASETRSVAALDHSYTAVVTAPTCTADGYTTYTCSVCGDSYTGNTVAATGHSWDDGIITKEPTEEEAGTKAYTCKTCGATKEETIPALSHTHSYTAVITDPTCTEDGYTTYTCICGDTYTADEVPATGHDVINDYGTEASCTEPGLTDGSQCNKCGEILVAQEVIPALGHNEVIDVAVVATCTEDGLTEGKHCDRCSEVLIAQEVVPAAGHTWDEGKITKEPTEAETGIKTFACTICGETREETIPALGVEYEIFRLSGKGRVQTAIKAADVLKEVLGVNTFDAIIIASGDNFADALTGSYLASVKGAPILLYRANANDVAENEAYIQKNLSDGGTVYILGGTAAVPESVETALMNAGHKVVRLSGKSRFETNLKILEEAGVSGQEILISTGWNYADSLSASATGLPILMVNTQSGKLTKEQITFFEDHRDNIFTIIGGTGAVSEVLEEAIEEIVGTTDRVYGKTREATSVAVADRYFDAPDYAFLAYSRNFPDGLCGGPVAYTLNAPLLLVNAGQETEAKEYVNSNAITKGYILGGTAAVSDEIVQVVFDLSSDVEITVR